MIDHRMAAIGVAVTLLGASIAYGQGRPDSAALIAAQREAMEPLAYMDGVWRGPAKTTLPSGETRAVTQTERIGPFLGGAGTVIEGRRYDAPGQAGVQPPGANSPQPRP